MGHRARSSRVQSKAPSHMIPAFRSKWQQELSNEHSKRTLQMRW